MTQLADPSSPPAASSPERPTPRAATRPAAAPLGTPSVGTLSATAWLQGAVVAGLFAALYWPNLHRLWLKVNPVSGEPNWGHSVVVPVVGLYYLYVHRDALLATPVRPLLPTLGRAWQAVVAAFGLGGAMAVYVGPVVARAVAPSLAGSARTVGLAVFAACVVALLPTRDKWQLRSTLGVMLAGGLVIAGGYAAGGGLGVYAMSAGAAMVGLAGLAVLFDWGVGCLVGGLMLGAYGIWPGQNDYVWDCGMILTLFGVVLTLCGWGVMRFAWFPIAFLVCALPWPPLVYSKLALPLQYLAARVAVGVLQIVQVDASFVGTKIVMPTGRTLNVAEACAGLRSLMTFITLGAAVAFLSDRPLWQKVFITVSAVPIAIFCNVMRVSGMGVLDFYVSEGFSQGFAHQFAGMVMLIPAFFLLLALAWVLDGLFIEEDDDPAPVPA